MDVRDQTMSRVIRLLAQPMPLEEQANFGGIEGHRQVQWLRQLREITRLSQEGEDGNAPLISDEDVEEILCAQLGAWRMLLDAFSLEVDLGLGPELLLEHPEPLGHATWLVARWAEACVAKQLWDSTASGRLLQGSRLQTYRRDLMARQAHFLALTPDDQQLKLWEHIVAAYFDKDTLRELKPLISGAKRA